MMTERVKKEIEKLAKEYKGRSFKYDTWESIIRESDISFSTFLKYIELKKVIKKEEVSVEYLVNLLNDVSGEDLYGSSWRFEAIDGKAYEINEMYKWE